MLDVIRLSEEQDSGGCAKKGRYLMDYSRKYQEPYDVAEKAREHMQTVCARKQEEQPEGKRSVYRFLERATE